MADKYSKRAQTKNKKRGQDKFDGESQLTELREEAALLGLEVWELEAQRKKEEEENRTDSDEEDKNSPYYEDPNKK
jgi:hypothetical protein